MEGLRARGLPIAFSDDAGRYLCNAMLFTLLDRLSGSGVGPVGFIHVPYVHAPTASPETVGSLPFGVCVDTLTALVEGLLLSAP